MNMTSKKRRPTPKEVTAISEAVVEEIEDQESDITKRIDLALLQLDEDVGKSIDELKEQTNRRLEELQSEGIKK